MSRKIRIRQLALSLALVLLIVGLAKTASAANFVITEPPTPCPVPCPGTSTPLGVPVTTGMVVLLQPLPGTSLPSCPTTQASTNQTCWSDIVSFTSDAAGNGVATILSDCNDKDCPFPPPPPPGVFLDEFTGRQPLILQPLVFLVEDCSPTGNGTTVYTPSGAQPGGSTLTGGSNSYAIVSDCEPLPPPGVPEPSSFALIALSLASFVPFALLRRKRLQATVN